MDLKNIVQEAEQSAEWKSFPGTGFKVLFNELATTDYNRITRKCTKKVWNKKARQYEDTTDVTKERAEVYRVALHGFSGLTPRVLRETFKLSHPELNKIEKGSPDYDLEIPHDVDDQINILIALGNQSVVFHSWIQKLVNPDGASAYNAEEEEEEEKKIS